MVSLGCFIHACSVGLAIVAPSFPLDCFVFENPSIPRCRSVWRWTSAGPSQFPALLRLEDLGRRVDKISSPPQYIGQPPCMMELSSPHSFRYFLFRDEPGLFDREKPHCHFNNENDIDSCALNHSPTLVCSAVHCPLSRTLMANCAQMCCPRSSPCYHPGSGSRMLTNQ
jgi:hypothetical protein